MMWYMQANKVADHWKNPPAITHRWCRERAAGARISGSGAAYGTDLTEHMRRGETFAGTQTKSTNRSRRSGNIPAVLATCSRWDRPVT